MGNTQQERMEDISIAYVSAVAASNGYSVNSVKRDNDGVDMQLSCKGKPHLTSIRHSPQLDIQLKSSYSSSRIKFDNNGDVLYSLEAKNYNSLIDECRCNPLILVLLHLPEEETTWIEHTNQYLKLQKCAYWISLRGKPETRNKSSITIKIPCSNIFSPASLKEIMIKIGEGEEDQL